MAKHDTIEIKANMAGDVTPALTAEVLARGLDVDDSGDAKTSGVPKRLAGLDWTNRRPRCFGRADPRHNGTVSA